MRNCIRAAMALLLLLTTLAAGVEVASPASATTPSPCVYKNASPVTVQYVVPERQTTVLQGGGSISGCQKYVSGGVSVHACLQFQDPATGTWADVVRADGSIACGDDTGASGPHSKYAARASVTVQADCVVGPWRSHATGTDIDGTAWERTSLTFNAPAGDSGVCGATGGGDRAT